MSFCFDLHLRQEKDLKVIEYTHDLFPNDHSKIKLTYEQAIEKIYELAHHSSYKPFFSKYLNEEMIYDPKASFVGAALDKLRGNIYVVINDDENKYAKILKWSFDHSWQTYDTSLGKNSKIEVNTFKEKKADLISYKVFIDHIYDPLTFHYTLYQSQSCTINKALLYFSHSSLRNKKQEYFNILEKEKFNRNYIICLTDICKKLQK